MIKRVIEQVNNNHLETGPCNICRSKKYKVIYKSFPYNVVSCSNCHLYYLNPRPNKEAVKSFYQSSYFNSGLNSTGYSNYSILDNELDLEAKKRIKLIKQYVKKGKLLDIGCGYGHFLKHAQEEGYNVMGLDISKEAIKKLRMNYGLLGKVGDVVKSKLTQGNFDVITSWDTVEHFSDPKASFKAIYKLQKTNGFLFLTTPSIDSFDAKVLGKYWYGFKRIPEHLYFFSRKHISIYLEQAGYKVIKISNWGFYRNLRYFVDQVARYDKKTHSFLKIMIEILRIENKTFYFPIIDMFVVAQKNK